MRKSIISLVLILSFSLIISSCQKGENDPLISLASRDARITALWNLADYEKTSITVQTNGSVEYTTTINYSYDGTTLTKVTTSNAGTDTELYSYSSQFEIKKDGTYRSENIQNGKIKENKSNWWWIDSKLNKIGIVLEYDGSYIIDRLASDELVLFNEKTVINTNAANETDSTYVYEKLTFEKQ